MSDVRPAFLDEEHKFQQLMFSLRWKRNDQGIWHRPTNVTLSGPTEAVALSREELLLIVNAWSVKKEET